MTQINVHPDTHKLVKELSYKTGKSVHQVAREAFIEYQQSMSGENRLLSKFLERVTETIVDAMKQYVIREVPVAVKAVVKELLAAQEEVSAKAACEAERVLEQADIEEIDSYDRPPEQK